MNDTHALELLENLVRIPSVSRNEAAAVRFLVDRMAELGFETEIDAAGNAIGRLGDSGPRVALVGHIDTVPGDIPVRIEDERLYGRGSVDAKGCLATFVAATARAHAAGTLRCRVEVVGCVEEEVSSSKGAHYRAGQPAPDALVIGEPSGAHAVTTGYKGFLAAQLTWRKGLAHTAGPEAGPAATACRHFVELERAAAAFDAGTDVLYERLLLHLAHVSNSDDGRYGTSRLDLRLRLPETLDPDAAIAWLREASPGWDVDAAGGLAAWSGPRTSPVARYLGRSIGRAGARARYQRKTGTADLNVLAPAWKCPAVAYGPGDSALDHTPDEHLDLHEYRAAIAILGSLLADESFALSIASTAVPAG